MPITISGSTGIAGVDGSASTPAVQGTDTNTGIFFPAADTIAFGEGGSEAMRIDSSGNVGIGTSSPGQKLDVNGIIKNNNEIRTQLDNTYYSLFNTAGTRYGYLQGTSGALTLVAESGASNVLVFNTNSTERARFDSSGNFLVGTATRGPVNASAFDLDVTNSVIYCSHANGKASGSEYIQFGYNGSGIGSITQNGTTAVAYNTSSDYRLKHDVQPMAAGLSTVAALKPVTYKWNTDNSYGEGFIAHELQAIIPQAVTGEKDAVNVDGSIRPQGVDYSKIVVHLVAAIQELKADNDAMKERIATLEAK